MKCAACNTENPPNAKFCLSCGAALVAPQPSPLPPGAVQEGKSAGLRVTPTAIGIVVLLLISAAGAAYVGFTWYEDSTRGGETTSADERAIEEKRRKAEQDRLAEERQKASEAEREKQRQQADAEQAMRLAREKADEDRKRADNALKATDESAKRAEAKVREEERAKQEARAREEAKARDEAKAREQARAREEARARELARQREEKAAQAREARARQAASSNATRLADTQAYTPAPAPAPVAVAQAPVAAAPAQNDPCAGLSGLKREQCTSCNRHTGLRKSACEDRAIDRYCEGKWNKPGQPDCVDPRRR